MLTYVLSEDLNILKVNYTSVSLPNIMKSYLKNSKYCRNYEKLTKIINYYENYIYIHL